MDLKPRKIALDVGDKTIGIALSDNLGLTGQGLMTYQRTGIKKDTDFIVGLIKEYSCDALIIGLPLNLDGSDSIQTEKVRAFRKKMENKLASSGLKDVKVLWQDERYTTVIAEEVLLLANLSREERKTVIDKQAAVLIMQSYLDNPHDEDDVWDKGEPFYD